MNEGSNGFTYLIGLMTVVFCSFEAVRLDGIQAAGVGFIALNWTTMLIVWLGLLADANKESVTFLRYARKALFRE